MRATKQAEVVGGGIAGLTTAVLLARRGWNVRVHERAPAIREIGAGIFLKNNSLNVLEEMGLYEQLAHHGVHLTGAEIREEHGRVLQRRSLQGSSRVLNVPRQVLIVTLYDAAVSAGVEVLTSSSVRTATPEGELIPEDDRRWKADLVIASDGFHSRIREALGLTVIAKILANGATRLLVPRTEKESMTKESWSGARRIGIAPCTREQTYVYMSCSESDERGRTVPVDIDSWARAFPHLREAFDRMAGAAATHYPYTIVRCRSWSKGRVAIVGDAAHAMPPTLGQGAGLAITNARALVDALASNADAPAALRAWERKQRPVTEHTQRWSLRYDALTTAWPAALSGVRSGVIWVFGRARWLNNMVRIADRTVVGKS